MIARFDRVGALSSETEIRKAIIIQQGPGHVHLLCDDLDFPAHTRAFDWLTPLLPLVAADCWRLRPKPPFS